MRRWWPVLMVGAAAQEPFVVIHEPSANAVVAAHGSDERNRAPVRVVLHFYDLHLVDEASRAGMGVWLRIDRSQSLTLGPPLPDSTFELWMRLGTHSVEAALVANATATGVEDDASTPAGVDPASIATSVFDLVPAAGAAVLRKSGTEQSGTASRRPSSTEKGWHRCEGQIRVVLVGSLALGGQAMLALEQARYLPRLSSRRGLDPAFEIVYATSARQDANSHAREPLKPLLEALGVRVVRYASHIPVAALDELATDGDYAAALADALSRAETLDALSDALKMAASGLIDVLRGAHVVSFTNHEAFVDADRFILECARLAGVPHVLNEPSNLWWGRAPAGADASGLVSGLVLPSTFAADFWSRRGVTVPLFVINPGVALDDDPRLFQFSEDQPSANQPFVKASSKVPRVAFVGRLAPQKSPGLFVRAAAAVAGVLRQATPGGATPTAAEFLVIGDGPLKEACEALARALGVSIEFRGWLAPELVRETIRNETDVVVHTNVLEETFCMCNVEAMAEGRPVVTFGVGGVSDYLAAGASHGVVVEEPSVPALADAILKVLRDPVKSRAAGQLAARRVRGLDGGDDLSFRRMASQYANLYADLACAPATAADILRTSVEVACQGVDVSQPPGDPGRLLELGRTWDGACAIARHLSGSTPGFVAAERGTLDDEHGVDGVHALALALAVASGAFVLPEVPEGRGERALRTVVDLADLGAEAATRLHLAASKKGALSRIAAMARVALGDNPNTAADGYADLAKSRRGDVSWCSSSPETREKTKRKEDPSATTTTTLDGLLEETVASIRASSNQGVQIVVNDGGQRVIELSVSGAGLRDDAASAFYASAAQLRHDSRQFEYLSGTKKLELDCAGRVFLERALHVAEEQEKNALPGADDEVLLKKAARALDGAAIFVEETLGDDPTLVADLRDLALANPANTDLRVSAAIHGKLIHLVVPASVPGSPLGNWSGEALESEFYSNNGVAYVDGALRSDALDAIRTQLLESTIWFDVKRGHIGAYLDDGLASGVLLQVAEAFRRRLPTVLGRKRLVQAWAYKYLYNGTMGIRPHADEGAITVNCWLTPDHLNLDLDTGGLKVFLAEAPSDLDFATANHDFRRLASLIDSAPSIDVPHRQNRCLVFKSRWIHQTQPLFFRAGYRASRINLSLMYGNTAWSPPTHSSSQS